MEQLLRGPPQATWEGHQPESTPRADAGVRHQTQRTKAERLY
eukprot:SM005541S17894  [mRNA]  locus=s5541:348:767:- [translate_table: standard]